MSSRCCRADSGGASGATACKASGRWCVLHVNHQMFLKRATGGGGGRRAATAGRVGWLPRGLGCHQEPWAQTADLAHTWTPRLSLGKNKADPIYARWDKLTVVQNAQTGAIPSKQDFGSNNITGRCWCYQSSHNSGSVPCNEKVFFFFFLFLMFFCMHDKGSHTHIQTYTHTFTPQILYHLPLSYFKKPGDTMFFVFDVPRLCLSWLTDWVTWGRGKLSGYYGDGHLPSL